MSHEYEQVKGKIVTPAVVVSALAIVIMATFVIYRMFNGIGPITNLSDGYPWGIWLGYDVAIGSAFACGGYILAIICYIMNGWKYHPMIRSAVLASMFGYALAGASVMVDIGRYWNSYGFFVPSRMQINSVMFEVALCIMAYTTVLIIEFLPSVLDRFTLFKNDSIFKKVAIFVGPKLDKVLIFIIVLGVTLPSMHQSSLGSLFIIMGTKLHVLWQTNLLPLLFLLNAMTLGLAIVFFETGLASAGFKRRYEYEALDLAKFAAVVSGLWLVVRFGDLIYRGEIAAMYNSGAMSGAFWAEIILIAIPFLIFLSKPGPKMAFYAGLLLCLGGGIYRFNVYVTGFNAGPGFEIYFPSFPEFMVTFGFVAVEVFAYLVLVKLLRIFPKEHAAH